MVEDDVSESEKKKPSKANIIVLGVVVGAGGLATIGQNLSDDIAGSMTWTLGLLLVGALLGGGGAYVASKLI